MKKMQEFNCEFKIEQIMQDASGIDTLKEISPISKEEFDYYINLKEVE